MMVAFPTDLSLMTVWFDTWARAVSHQALTPDYFNIVPEQNILWLVDVPVGRNSNTIFLANCIVYVLSHSIMTIHILMWGQ